MSQAYTDEEASPPEWVDLLSRVREAKKNLVAEAGRATETFVMDRDIKRALRQREKAAERLRTQATALNQMIARLNLLAPHTRFTRASVDAGELLRPLFHSRRRSPG